MKFVRRHRASIVLVFSVLGLVGIVVGFLRRVGLDPLLLLRR